METFLNRLVLPPVGVVHRLRNSNFRGFAPSTFPKVHHLPRQFPIYVSGAVRMAVNVRTELS